MHKPRVKVVKTYCKPAKVNVESLEFITPAVHLCFISKLKKKSFRELLVSTGTITAEEIELERREHSCNKINVAIDAVALWAVERIRARDLQLKPVREFTRRDGNSGKVRDLCQESPEQQIFEYIAQYALRELFQAKLLHCQYGSMPNKGQVGGKRRIERILRKKHKGQLDAVQCDVTKAYPSTKVSLIMSMLRRDIGKNKVLLWFVEAVMSNYPNGVLLIGGYLSCWLYNYVMSYVLRHLLSQAKYRRGKRLKMVDDIVNYADDFVLFGRLSNLERAIKVTVRWAKQTLGLNVKKAWKITRIASFASERKQKKARNQGSKRRTPGIDMMGFVVRRTYTIIRGRTFVRFRRQIIRAGRELGTIGYVPWWRAQTILSDWGWLKHADSKGFCKKYNVYAIIRAAKKSVSWHSKRVKIYEQGVLCA